MHAMPTIGELIKLHRRQRGWSQTELARRVGANQQDIARIEKGTVKKSGFLPTIFHVLQLDHTLLAIKRLPQKQLEDDGVLSYSVVGPTDLRIYGAISKGGVFTLTPETVETVARPQPLIGVPDGYGVYIVDDSMAPEFEPGDVAFFHPHAPIRADNTCVFYSEKPGGTPDAMIRRLVRVTRDTWHVRQWNPSEGETKDRILRRSEWQKAHMTVGKYARR